MVHQNTQVVVLNMDFKSVSDYKFSAPATSARDNCKIVDLIIHSTVHSAKQNNKNIHHNHIEKQKVCYITRAFILVLNFHIQMKNIQHQPHNGDVNEKYKTIRRCERDRDSLEITGITVLTHENELKQLMISSWDKTV